MSEYNFEIGGIRFSYSSTNTFETCPYSFKLSYVDAMTPRESNFFGEYGTLIHECLEKYFSGELDIFQLSQYYLDNFDVKVPTPAPPSYVDLYERYKEQGLVFFDNFSFQREDYEIIMIEDKIDFEIGDIMFVAKPDLVLKRKKDGKNILFDYKTALPFKEDKRTGTEITDFKKIEGYNKQMFIYTYALGNHANIPIDEISIWYTRADRIITIPWSKEKETEAMDWIIGVVNKIRKEQNFYPNPNNKYFCNNLCGVRNFCEYREQ